MNDEKINKEAVLTRAFQQTGLISEKFFGDLRIKYTEGKITHIIREQSIKFKD